ncbi:MAG: hypothetical protein U0271_13225 [Polyangiaceae bacterium]
MLGLGCGDDGTGGGNVDCTTVKKYSQLTWTKCTNCHSTLLTDLTSRQSAPLEYNYDSYDEAKKFPDQLVEQVEDDEMPPAGSTALTASEKTDMLTWAQCGTPN